MNESLLRAGGASLMVLAYATMCLAIWRRQRQQHLVAAQAAEALAGDGAQPPVLVLFASQTGQAEAIAWQTGRAIHAKGTPVRVMALNDVDVATLQGAERALFVISTYGEGDAPDGASLFAEQVMGTSASLSGLRYALLALGDRQYTRFCGFGRALDAWLQVTGAVPVATMIEADNLDPVALSQWHAQWGGGDAPAESPSFVPWQLVARERLNPGSQGGPVFQLGFKAPPGSSPAWQSGDLVQVALVHDPSRPRDYSIASIASDGELQLLVRQESHPDGTLGAASGLLTSTLALGDSVAMRLRPHRNFQLEDNAERPLILIGNGTGLAGLRSHLRARAAAGRHENWLLFGEREAAHDFLCRDELQAWHDAGVLRRLDMVFSRDQPERLYVQHRLLQLGDDVQTWLARGAAIYVCGSLQGMAGGVDGALRQLAGDSQMRALTAAGRYRRDVY
jgi:sulfite reductase (NADPH) flavoprotein alpha-component